MVDMTLVIFDTGDLRSLSQSRANHLPPGSQDVRRFLIFELVQFDPGPQQIHCKLDPQRLALSQSDSKLDGACPIWEVAEADQVLVLSILQELFRNANMTTQAKLFKLFNGVTKPSDAPFVHTYSFFGSELKTIVGVKLQTLEQGVFLGDYIYGVGDGDQEATDNLSNMVWKKLMGKCYHFEAIEFPRTSHLMVPFTLSSMRKTLSIIKADKPRPCIPGAEPRFGRGGVFGRVFHSKAAAHLQVLGKSMKLGSISS